MSSVPQSSREDKNAGAYGNTPLRNFGIEAGSALADALGRVVGRLPKSLALGVVRSGDEVQKLHLGFDTLEWTAEIDEEQLELLSAECAAMADSVEPIEIDGLELVVRRVGGPSHCWRICLPDGFEVRVPRQSMYRLRVLAAPKWVLGREAEYVELDASVAVMRACNLPALPVLRLSRVDVALDLLLPVSRFDMMLERIATRHSSVVRRARLLVPRLEGDSYRSLQVGKSDVVLRIYDKMTEAVKTGDWSFWSQIYGAIEIPDGYTVVRFEYQLRSGFLRQEKGGVVEDLPDDMRGDSSLTDELMPGGIWTLQEFRMCAPSVLLYLTQAWFRFAGSPSGAENVRATLSWWQAISNAFVVSDWYRFAASVWRSCKRVASKNLDRLASMTAGCLSALAAVISYQKDGDRVGVRDALDWVFDYLMGEDARGRDRYDRWVEGRNKRMDSIRFGVAI